MSTYGDLAEQMMAAAFKRAPAPAPGDTIKFKRQPPFPAITVRQPGMKIEISRINNGWLVGFNVNPNESDPLAQRGPRGQTFADTLEAVCGLIAEQVLKLDQAERSSP